MTNLTSNEIAALKVCLNYDNQEAQLSDNYSNGGLKEFMSELCWNRHQAAAVIGSLEEKGVGYSEASEGNGENTFWLSDLGVNPIFDIIEGE